MVKKLFVLVAILFMGLAVSAQTNMRDVVYLKNGGITKGIIIEQIPNESIKIQTADGSIFVYKMDEIEKMSKETIENNNSTQPQQTNVQVQMPGTPIVVNPNMVQMQGNPNMMNQNVYVVKESKSQFLAGFLSFLLPGCGELYATSGKKGTGMLLWSLLGEPLLFGGMMGIGISTGSEDLVSVGAVFYGISHLLTVIYSISEASKLAKQTNIQNGYFSFKIGDKASLGFRPEFSYNNLMMPSGSVSPQFTTGIGLSLTF